MTETAIEEIVQDKFKLAGIDEKVCHSCGFKVHDPRFYERVFREGSLGLGESYMNGWWDADHVDEFIYYVTKGDVESTIRPSLQQLWLISKFFLLIDNRRTAQQKWENVIMILATSCLQRCSISE